ncbi:hypothetical protein L596_023383 [Steinernema carpocapsae]|uniref:Peptidase A1 domain-containing protein n=1 Tax=Steinernema carpocapsae TaxID=34508 RepID=A0A4U5MDG7_STECR|nr:hypothetical protein L596_023383 [Steinernema carpocapsae]
MLRWLLFASLVALCASLAFRTLQKRHGFNLRVHRRLPRIITSEDAQKHYHHDPEDMRMLVTLLAFSYTTNYRQVPSVQVDVTSSDLVMRFCYDVPNPSSSDPADCFNPKYSKTYVKISDQLGMDDIHSGFPAFDPWTVHNVTFAYRNNTGQDVDLEGASGTLGLAGPSLRKYADSYFPEMVYKHLNLSVFSVMLGKTGQSGAFHFGMVCPLEPHNNTIFYIPTTSSGYWQFSIRGFKFGKVHYSFKSQAVISTKKGYIGMPGKFLKEMMISYGVQWDGLYGAYTVDCSGNNLPDFEVIVDGEKLVITSAMYVYLQTPLANGRCVVNFEDSQKFGFGPEWYFGMPLIQSYCLVFDYGNKRIGFMVNSM